MRRQMHPLFEPHQEGAVLSAPRTASIKVVVKSSRFEVVRIDAGLATLPNSDS